MVPNPKMMSHGAEIEAVKKSIGAEILVRFLYFLPQSVEYILIIILNFDKNFELIKYYSEGCLYSLRLHPACTLWPLSVSFVVRCTWCLSLLLSTVYRLDFYHFQPSYQVV
jgi:hypothetical protein